MLQINNLIKKYGDKTVVNDISITIEDGDIYGFIGHNGAGKTTTIKSICGIIKFNKGEILINGKNISNNPIECKAQLAYIPDDPKLFANLSGIAYLKFMADMYDIGEERNSLIEKYTTLFEIQNDLANPISSYSHGMKQKLAICGALIHKPRVILLDEPFVGLDPVASHNLKQIMKELASEGVSIFFSSHVLEVVEKLCNKIAIIKDGVIVTSGDTEEIVKDSSLEDLFLQLQGVK